MSFYTNLFFLKALNTIKLKKNYTPKAKLTWKYCFYFHFYSFHAIINLAVVGL